MTGRVAEAEPANESTAALRILDQRGIDIRKSEFGGPKQGKVSLLAEFSPAQIDEAIAALAIAIR